jgi:DNA mismatch repair protein MutH
MGAPVPSPPRSEAELLARSRDVAGLTLGELAARLGREVPTETRRGKGFAGQLVEAALGATAGSLPEPDFQLIGVELKTVPVGAGGRPVESTYVCTLPLEHDRPPDWEHSNVRRKLARVLWLPVEADPGQPLALRRVGSAVAWSPSADEEQALRADWEEFTDLVVSGRVAEITAHQGTCLQVRPKAADSRARRWGVDERGERMRTLPRGFYLRAAFTAALLARLYAGAAR